MSKGGAGKVYFVLYLAVILELLIIFIERDEAEEGLRKQQQQAIQIVQTILSQLQTGGGVSSIMVRPNDDIVLDEREGKKIAKIYTVSVAVGDPQAQLPYNGGVIKGDDIPKLEYIISHTGNAKLEQEKLGPDSADIEGGSVIFKAELGPDVSSTSPYTTPHQTEGGSIPTGDPSKYFTIDEELTAAQVALGRRVKVFTVNFKPTQEGWYRLRFHSQMNKILGVNKAPEDADTVRIGTVKLSVKQLHQVQKVLEKQRGQGGQASQVEAYIKQLLTPNAYKDFEENKSIYSFNVHVTKPLIQPPAEPVATISSKDTTYWYNVSPYIVKVTLGPKEGSHTVQGASLTDLGNGNFLATYDSPNGNVPIVATSRNKVGKLAQDEKLLIAEAPALRYAKGISQWRGMRATYGLKYDPSTEWVSTNIPPGNYQTVVEFDGKVVMDKPGTNFKGALGPEMAVTENVKNVKTTVYWNPGGTSPRDKWVALLTNQKDGVGVIKPDGSKPFNISYQSPEQDGTAEAEFVISPKKLTTDITDIILKQRVGEGKYVGVSASSSCDECGTIHVSQRLLQDDDQKWKMVLDFDPKGLTPAQIQALNGKRFDITITMTGRGGANATATVTVTLKISR